MVLLVILLLIYLTCGNWNAHIYIEFLRQKKSGAVLMECIVIVHATGRRPDRSNQRCVSLRLIREKGAHDKGLIPS